jgi:serine/threonine protein kinase
MGFSHLPVCFAAAFMLLLLLLLPQNDIWNLGVLIWEALAGHHPFGDHTTSPGAFMCTVVSKSHRQIAAGISVLLVSQACKDWLGLALQKDPRN